MQKNIVLILAILCALVVLYRVVGKSSPLPLEQRTRHVPHFYERPDVPIDRIEIVALYFVPSDRVREAYTGWDDVLRAHLESVREFHTVQFLGRSTITYTVLSDIVVGQHEGEYYEVASPSHTDPLSIDPITRELGRRLLDPAGDLWPHEEAHGKTDARRVYLVVFEGDGAAGSGDVALISRAYLTDKAYAPFATTFLAHEFYHTLGIPDGYDSAEYVFEDAQQTSVGLLKSADIMGRVRVPIEYTYLDRATLRAMGI